MLLSVNHDPEISIAGVDFICNDFDALSSKGNIMPQKQIFFLIKQILNFNIEQKNKLFHHHIPFYIQIS